MQVDEKFRIVYDENNVILQFHEIRIKTKKDGTEEQYEFVDNFYYSNITQALKSYTNKCLNGSNSILGLIKRIENLETLIPNLK